MDLIGLWASPGVGAATVAAVRRLARARGLSPAQVAGLPPARLRAAGCPARGLRALGQAPSLAPAARRATEALARLGAAAICAGQPEYPARLGPAMGRQAPPLLSVAGRQDLLGHRPCVAVVGSREPSPRAREACRALCTALATDAAVLVSGGARGIDTLAHTAGLEHGAALVVSPVGLQHHRWRGRRPSAGDSWCLVSQFPPDAGWRDAQALMRNRVIVALADAVVAFEPRDRGGTWHSANQALKMGRALFVINGAQDRAQRRGQHSLVRRGAMALDPCRMPGPAELLRMAAEHESPDRARQTGLFGSGG